MAMTMQDAERARQLVLATWGHYIPAEVQRYTANRIFVFYTDPSYFRAAFGVMWDAAFQKVVVRECTARKPRTVANLQAQMDNIDAASTGGSLAGFVTASRENRQRRIHINPESQEFDPIGALAHEYIHFLSHPNFYPDYYKEGGDNPFRVEGATDWITIHCFSDYFQDLPVQSRIKGLQWQIDNPAAKPLKAKNRAAYTANFQKTNAWIKADARNRDRLLRFVFGGVRTNLSAIHP
jgi:hypothetical protein